MGRRPAAGGLGSSTPPTMSLREVEHSIRTTISDRSAEKDAVALDVVHTFVSQKPAAVPELESTLQGIYDTTHSIDSLDLFVEILYIMRDHLTVESISRVW